MNRPRYSLIIPAHNEEALLPRLLESVTVARRAYRGGADTVEVIVADNVSTDRTARIALQRGCRVAPVAERCIAAARNAGAAVAAGEILAFIDADSTIHPQTFDRIDETIADGKCIAGATGVTLERWSLGLSVTYAMMLPLVFATGMDTGVVFCRRVDFDRVGGYNERLLLAEDVDFLWRLRRLGRSGGRRLVRATSAKAVASTRKFDDHGDWHYLRKGLPLLLSALFSRRAFERFARQYWYDCR